MITRMDKIKIPFSEFSFTFARSGGPGGQNINKVNTKVMMYWNLPKTTCCSEAILERFRQKYSQYILEDGQVQVISQKFRNQKANIEDCIEKLEEMLNSVAMAPKIRRATKPKKSSILKRLQTKKRDGEKKRLRKSDY